MSRLAGARRILKRYSPRLTHVHCWARRRCTYLLQQHYPIDRTTYIHQGVQLISHCSGLSIKPEQWLIPLPRSSCSMQLLRLVSCNTAAARAHARAAAVLHVFNASSHDASPHAVHQLMCTSCSACIAAAQLLQCMHSLYSACTAAAAPVQAWLMHMVQYHCING